MERRYTPKFIANAIRCQITLILSCPTPLRQFSYITCNAFPLGPLEVAHFDSPGAVALLLDLVVPSLFLLQDFATVHLGVYSDPVRNGRLDS